MSEAEVPVSTVPIPERNWPSNWDHAGRQQAKALLAERPADAGPLTPLEDPDYHPKTRPTRTGYMSRLGGGIPPEVEHWGAATQIRWFSRFFLQLRPRHDRVWRRFYVTSESHKGLCCLTCEDELVEGARQADPSQCCCFATSEPRHA